MGTPAISSLSQDEEDSVYAGRGVVMLVTPDTLEAGVAALSIINRMAPSLSLQAWYRKADFPASTRLESLKAYARVSWVAFEDYVSVKGRNVSASYLRVLALLHSPFQHVLLLGSLCVPCKPFEYLFESAAYLKFGTVFWPAYSRTDPSNPLWALLDLPYRDGWEQHSAVMLIDKTRAIKAIRLVRSLLSDPEALNSSGRETHLFAAAWMKTDSDFYMVETRSLPLGNFFDRQFCGTKSIFS
jgi:hypothetical protein